MKRKFTILLSLLVVASSVMMAESINVVSDGIKFTIDTAPEYNYAYVTGAEDSRITSLVIPETVEYDGTEYPVRLIKQSAFSHYSNLESVTFPSTLKFIDGYAFMQTGLKTLELPEGIEYIGNSAFANCNNLESVELSGCLKLDNFVFGNDPKLTSFTLPENIEDLSTLVFKGSKNLAEINIGENSPLYASIDGVLYSKDGKTLVIFPSAKDLEPEIPEGVTSIGDMAFYQTPIQFVNMPSTLETIGTQAFYGCTGMEDIEIGENVTVIDAGAFQNCSQLINIIFNDKITAIGSNAFSSCSKLVSVEIPNSVTMLGENAFSFCYALKDVTIGNGLTDIGNGCFSYDSALTDVNFSEGLVSLGSKAFASCSMLEEVNLPSSLETIGDMVFWGCGHLKTAHIGSNVTNIGSSAFLMTGALENLYVEAIVPPAVQANSFSSYTATLHVPEESVDAYVNSDVWKNFTNIIGNIQTGAEYVNADEKTFRYEGGNLFIEDGITVRVTDISGAIVKTGIGSSVIDLSDLAPSLYVISDGKRSIKILK